MKIWKSFLPGCNELNIFSALQFGRYFVDRKNIPEWETVYFPTGSGDWLSLTWNYFDVEFKFEVYGLSIDQLAAAPQDLTCVGTVPIFSQITFLLKTEWTRPTKPGEVPDNFEQIIEENGNFSNIPNTAISVGTALHGIVFSGDKDDSKLLLSINDAERYSLKSTVDTEEIVPIAKSCDALTLSEILIWTPPI